MTEVQPTSQTAPAAGRRVTSRRTASVRSIRVPRGWLVEGAWAAAAGLVSLVLAGLWLHIWQASLHVPLFSSGDASYSALLTKTVMKEGWVGVDHHLGYPHGSALYDDSVSFGDSLHLLIIKVLALGSSDPIAVMNVFFLLTFALVAISGYAVLRDFAMPRGASLVSASLFSLLPYHFLRNESHLFLAAYYSVPLGCWLILRTLRADPLFVARVGDRRRLARWLTGRSVATIAACLVVGTAEVYYSAFTLLLLVPLALLGAAAARDWRRLVPAAAAAATIVAATIVVQLPQIVWHLANGANKGQTTRQAFESELYALKLTNLVVPLPGHPFAPLNHLATTYYSHLEAPATGDAAIGALGSWLTLAFVASVLLAAACAAGLRPVGRARLAADAGVGAVLAFAFATVGGTGALFGYFVSPQLRGWGRISVFVAFFAAIALAAGLAAVWERRARPTRGHRALAAVVLLAVLYTGYRDQTRVGFRPTYAANRATWRSDARFFAGVESALPGRAPILQLPYMSFPENGPLNGIQDYDELKGYLHSDRLRWSYAASKGRHPDDWDAQLDRLPLIRALPGAVAAGFKGLVVDTKGYSDGGAAMVAQLQKTVGRPPALRSEDGRLVFFDLAPLVSAVDRQPQSARDRAAAAVLDPVRPDFGKGFFPEEHDAADSWHWAARRSTLTVDNPTRLERRARLDFEVQAADGGTFVTIATPDRRVHRVAVASGVPARVSLSIDLPPGRQALRFATDAPDVTSDSRDIHLRVLDFSSEDPALGAFARSLERGS